MTKAKKIVVNLFNNIFVFSALFFLSLGIAVYVLTGRSAVNMLSEQMLHREQVITRSGASAIQSFFTLFGNSISISAQNSSISLSNLKESEKVLIQLVTSSKKTPIGGFALLNDKGLAVLNSSVSSSGPVSGGSFQDRDYYLWSKSAKAGEYFIAKPVISRLGASSGKMIIPIASPVIREDGYQGILTSAVILSDLTGNFLDPLRISDKSEVYLIKDDGEIICADRFQEPVGKNIFSYLGDNSFLGSKYLNGEVKKALASRKEGKVRVVYPRFDQSGGLLERLVAYSPIDLGNGQLWYLVISTPFEDALVFMGPFYLKQVLLTILIFIAILIYAVRFSKLRGFKEGHELYHQEKISSN